jgi:Zn-finger nucleic acid-binding protein
VAGIRLDLCLGCHGLWLDEKQLHLLGGGRPGRMTATDGVPGEDCRDMDEVVFDLVMSIGP